MNLKDLRNKELSNLYALLKQTNIHFEENKISFLTDKKQIMVTYYISHMRTLEEKVSEVLKELSINPGNTIDSIIEEITENLKDIIKMDISDEIREKGYLLCINRLMAYQIANLENLNFFQEEGEHWHLLTDEISEFKNLQQSIF